MKNGEFQSMMTSMSPIMISAYVLVNFSARQIFIQQSSMHASHCPWPCAGNSLNCSVYLPPWLNLHGLPFSIKGIYLGIFKSCLHIFWVFKIKWWSGNGYTVLNLTDWPCCICNREVFQEFDPIAVSKINEKKIATPGNPASCLLSELKLRGVIENARQTCKVCTSIIIYNVKVLVIFCTRSC